MTARILRTYAEAIAWIHDKFTELVRRHLRNDGRPGHRTEDWGPRSFYRVLPVQSKSNAILDHNQVTIKRDQSLFCVLSV